MGSKAKKILSIVLIIIGIITIASGLGARAMAKAINASTGDFGITVVDKMFEYMPALFATLFLVVGVVIITIGVTILVLETIQEAKDKKITAEGIRIDATIVGIEDDPDIEINGEPGKKIVLRGKNPEDGKEYEFKSSDSVLYDPQKEIESLAERTLPVYISRTDYSEYVVDISKIKEAHEQIRKNN